MTSDAPAASPSSVAAIILAAGSSTRMGGTNKIWEPLADEPVIASSIRIVASVPTISTLIIVAPEADHRRVWDVCASVSQPVQVVEGGARRQDSVACGLAAAPEAAWYLVHDAARPLVTVDLVRRVLDGARTHGAAIPGVAVYDALKRVDGNGRVVSSVDRSDLRAIQTPQGFAGPLLRRAHATVQSDVLDDGTMVEALSEPVQVIEGDPENIKITTVHDLAVARYLLAQRRVTTAG